MNKICTSIKQSKILIELGIDVKTADMCYIDGSDNDCQVKDGTLDDEDIPAWSLTALSKFILSSIMDDNENVYKFYISKDSLNRWIAYYKNDNDNVSIYICEESEDLINVIFEMVYWLLKYKKL
jgi:hypothetical protein